MTTPQQPDRVDPPPSGNWYREETGDALAPHLDHGPPLGPHYDYVDADGAEYRLFPDDRRESKADGPATGALETADLGVVGQACLRMALAAGNHLSGLLQERPELTTGHVTAAVPAGTPAERIRVVAEGALMGQDAGWGHAVEAIRRLAHGRDDLVLVAENANARASQPRVRDRSGGYFTHADEVYEWTDALTEPAAVERCLRRANAPWLLNAVVARGRPPRPDEDEAYLADLARNAALVLVRAYDGEGFAIWSPG